MEITSSLFLDYLKMKHIMIKNYIFHRDNIQFISRLFEDKTYNYIKLYISWR